MNICQKIECGFLFLEIYLEGGGQWRIVVIFYGEFGFSLEIFAIFRHEKLIFQGADWKNLRIKSQKLHE